MLPPVFIRKLRGDMFKLIRNGHRGRQIVLSREHIQNRRFMVFFEPPEIRKAGILPPAGIGNVEYIVKLRRIAGRIQQSDALRAAPHIPAHGAVPDVEAGAGRSVRALGVDEQLIVVRVLVQP